MGLKDRLKRAESRVQPDQCMCQIEIIEDFSEPEPLKPGERVPDLMEVHPGDGDGICEKCGKALNGRITVMEFRLHPGRPPEEREAIKAMLAGLDDPDDDPAAYGNDDELNQEATNHDRDPDRLLPPA